MFLYIIIVFLPYILSIIYISIRFFNYTDMVIFDTANTNELILYLVILELNFGIFNVILKIQL